MKTTENHLVKTFDLIIIALMIALLVVSARINIALGPIPITLQTLMVILSGILLGPRRGWLVPVIYLFMGLVGFPFFATGGGIGYLFRPTFGFLLGFIPAAFIAGLIYHLKLFKTKYVSVILGALAGILIIYLVGFAYIPIASIFFGSKLAVWAMIIPTLPVMIIGDILKVAFLTAIVPTLQKEYEHIRQTLV